MRANSLKVQRFGKFKRLYSKNPVLKNITDILIEFYFSSILTVQRKNPQETVIFDKPGTMLWILLELQGSQPSLDEREVLKHIKSNRFLVKLSLDPKFRNVIQESKHCSFVSDGQYNNNVAETKINFRNLFELKGTIKDDARFAFSFKENPLGLLTTNEPARIMEKSRFDIDNHFEQFIGNIDQIFSTSHSQDFTSLINQNNPLARTFRFWENNFNVSQNSIKLTFDSLLFIDKVRNKQVADYAQSFETLPFSSSKVVSTRELVRDFISLTFHKKADSFSLSEDGTLGFKDWHRPIDNLSSSLMDRLMINFGPRINRFHRFFELKDSLTSEKSIASLFERSFLLNFVNIFDEYLSFQMIILSECQSIMDLVRKLEVLFNQTEQVVNFFEAFENNKAKINILDFISTFQLQISPSENLWELAKESFYLSIFPLLKTVYQVAFKNSPVDLLTKSLKITYEQDQDFNYKASNVPGLLEKIMENILITKNNYLLLSSADSELFSKSVKADFPWFQTLDVNDIKRVYQEVRAKLVAQQIDLNEVINKRMVI